MQRLMLFGSLLLFSTAALAQTAQTPSTAVAQSETIISSNGPVVVDYGKHITAPPGDAVDIKIAKQVRHQLLMLPLPYYGMFDDLEYSVQGRTVTLSGWLTPDHSGTKRDAENAVKRIEGVDKVVNNIKVLPTNLIDNEARQRVFRALAAQGPLTRYFWPISPDIRIIVDNMNVTLKGYVNNEGDKNLATIATKNVSDVFTVTNDLQVR